LFIFTCKAYGHDLSIHVVAPKRAVVYIVTVYNCLSVFLLGLLGKENSLDVRKNTTLGNGDSTEKLVQLFVVSYSQLQVTRDDSALLVVAGSVTGQLEDLSAQILENCSHVDWSTSTNTFSIVAFAKMTMDTTNGELKPCTG
jgi:hypothetical protein